MIELKNLSNRWGDFELQDVSLQAERGQYFVILGPCGSGKTLLLEAIAGLHQMARGRVLVDGQDITELPPEKRRIGLVYQQYALFPHLSVRDNIAYGLSYRKDLARGERKQRVDKMLELLDIEYLADRKRPVGLSGGEAQKVALGRALAIEPDVLLLDEPMSSLDQRARSTVVTILKNITKELNVPVVHVTHDYTEAATLADQVMILNRGREAQTGTVEDVFWKPKSRFVADFLGVENIFEGAWTQGEDGSPALKTTDLEITVPGRECTGNGAVCVRPEDVRLEAAPESRNTFEGTVREVLDQGFTIRLRITVRDTNVTVRVPRREFTELGVNVGTKTYLALPERQLHILEG
ncbi:MAG: ABC transporter ATP-binding protein [Lentisphaerae bacterium]|jgi:molybdate/tungstate transport system ATP-binding protein|nr:ABC transporter ATP-binding protein [Lentisphaerota bacterium]MBT4820155.1 ABC transporter ATP-binding protein [Lentisphaerota bacterium]MBT5607966.1 ABC transporter ATP-binding protein [Lentisphaerota bacterium]MBT7057493.1 ABC transporter ATP-binding protein [Lentisphaerota bacterium]MBT7845639.1 ABC transporter ATP-binding protein [Lentisphaerota bacterium]